MFAVLITSEKKFFSKAYGFLGTFEKLRQASVNFVIPIRPSVRTEQLGSHRTDFHKIWYLMIFRKPAEIIQVSLKSDKNNGHFTWRHTWYTFLIISRSVLLRMKNFSQKSCRQNENTYFIFFYYNQRMHYYTSPLKHLKCLRKNHSYMFRSTSDHLQGVKLYVAKNYSATIVVFLGYWLCCNSAFVGYNKRLWKNMHGEKMKFINTHFMFNNIFFFENRAIYEIMWKNIVQRDRPQMTIWRMRIACWIPKATNTHSQYVILIAFPLQQWLHERTSMLRYT
jgi:hypothetical protein